MTNTSLSGQISMNLSERETCPKCSHYIGGKSPVCVTCGYVLDNEASPKGDLSRRLKFSTAPARLKIRREISGKTAGWILLSLVIFGYAAFDSFQDILNFSSTLFLYEGYHFLGVLYAKYLSVVIFLLLILGAVVLVSYRTILTLDAQGALVGPFELRQKWADIIGVSHNSRALFLTSKDSRTSKERVRILRFEPSESLSPAEVESLILDFACKHADLCIPHIEQTSAIFKQAKVIAFAAACLVGLAPFLLLGLIASEPNASVRGQNQIDKAIGLYQDGTVDASLSILHRLSKDFSIFMAKTGPWRPPKDVLTRASCVLRYLPSSTTTDRALFNRELAETWIKCPRPAQALPSASYGRSPR